MRHDDDTDIHYKMLVLAKQHLCRAGVTGRLKFTLPPIVFESLKLLKKVRRMEISTAAAATTTVVPADKEEKEGDEKTDEDEKEGDKKEEEKGDEEGEATEEKEKEGEEAKEKEETEKEPAAEVVPSPVFNKKINCRKIFVFIQKTIAMLSLTDPEASFKLNLEAAIAADRCAVLAAAASSTTDQSTTTTTTTDYSAISYEFIAQAFQLYEDEISESKAQQRSIELVVGTLLSCKTFEKDDYEALITKTAQYAAKLLKKPDQCRMVTLCSHLFFTGVDANDKQTYRNPQRVLECLQRALKIADACSMASSANVQLFVEILEHYVYYFEKDNPVISDKFVSGLVALIKEHMESIGFSSSADQMVFAETQGHYRQILRYLQKKKEESESSEKFANVVC
uniref:Uncharacterized protein n=1 Tax=Helicotheca tamesis TaxID=374047 RepID=A0A7S2MWL0_9STRA